MHYPIVIHKDKDSDYGVIVPDIKGCFSAGSSYEEALVNVRESIECHVEGLLMDGCPLPIPHSVDEYFDNEDYAGGVWALVEIDLSNLSGKAKRINITLPEKVLSILDLYVKNNSVKNRSSLIADAALSYIAKNGAKVNS